MPGNLQYLTIRHDQGTEYTRLPDKHEFAMPNIPYWYYYYYYYYTIL